MPADPTSLSLSVCFPACNDSATIVGLVEAVGRVLEQLTDDYEIIVVNDGSKDNTGEVLDEAAKRYPKLRVFHHSQNQGYGGALLSAFSHATKEWVFYTDGDGQYDVRELDRLLRKIRPGVGLVNGFKTSRSDAWYRGVVGTAYKKTVKLLFNIKLRDVDCDFRLMRRELLQRIQVTSKSGAFCVELVRKLQLSGCEIEEVPVSHHPRVSGQSQFFCFKHISRTLLQVSTLWWRLILLPNLTGRKNEFSS